MNINLINFNASIFAANRKRQKKAANVPSSKPEENGNITDITMIHPVTLKQFMLNHRPAVPNPNIVSIFYYNDTHGNSDQMAPVLNAAKNFKDKSSKSNNTSFILSAGDNCSGADYKKNEFIFNLMQNIMGVDASVIGNHEADAGAEGFYKAAKDKNLTFVATNVEFDSDNPMNDIVKKSFIKEQNGVKYGFVGTMPIDFKTCTKQSVQKGISVLSFDDTIKALQNEIDNLKKQGVNRIILLSHIGYEADKKLVGQLDGVDIVVGGHTHVVVEGAKKDENILKSKTKEPVIIVQAGENGKYYGILNVEFDDNGVLTKVDNQLVQTKNKAKSPTVEHIKKQDLGLSPHVATIREVEPLPENRRIEPCAWTCLMADSMKSELDGDIAIINSANIRKVPAAGEVTQRDIKESSPMENKLVKAKLTQKQLVEAIRNAAKSTMQAQDGYPGLLQGSGFGYKIDDCGNLLDMYIEDKKGNKTKIDIKNPSDKITYTAIYDNFTAKADGETPELAPRFGYKEFDFDKDKTMCDYLSKMPDKENLVIKDDKRIQIIKTSQPKQKGSSSRKI